MKTFNRGTAATVTTTFALSGVLTDPTTVTLQVRTPAGVFTTYTYANSQITRNSTGIYHRDVTLDAEGIWTFRTAGTGAVVAADIQPVEVRRDVFP